MFTYKLVKSDKYIVVTPTDQFYRKFDYKHIIKNISRILSPIIIDKPLVIAQCNLSDVLIYNNMAFEIIQFYMNNIGNYINFKYTKHSVYSYWTFNFKITNPQLLLELL